MIHLIVWSKDRAAQLHLLLDSIQKNMPETFVASIIYTHSSPDFKAGYDRLQSEFDDDSRFGFLFETDLREQTLSLVSDVGFDNVAFSTDDTVIFKDTGPFDESLITADIVTFSLRYGLNTIVQNYHTGELQPPLNTYNEDGNTINWIFNQYHPLHNYGYPFGLDMHMYNRDMIYNLIKYMPFKNTNELESGLFHKRHLVPQTIKSFKNSVAVNIPNNNISGVTRAGETYGHTLEDLNKGYLSGKTINLDKLMQHEVHGCHQEIPMELTNG